jgi:glutamine cyclotransferase
MKTIYEADKVIFKVVYPGKGYRLVNIGERLVNDDDVSLMVVRNPNDRNWKKIDNALVGTEVNSPEKLYVPYGYYRRKITK